MERHKIARKKLIDELDLRKVLTVQRLSEFMSKISLSKHQRALVANFRQYQLDDLRPQSKSTDKKSTMYQPSLQQDPGAEFINAAHEYHEYNPNITEVQQALIDEIESKFKAQDNDIDKSILYEITGHIILGYEERFESDWQDFDNISGESTLIRLDKDEHYASKFIKKVQEQVTSHSTP